MEFTASSTTELEAWCINNQSKSHEKTFVYDVTKTDAQDSIITVTYTEKEKPIIEFETEKIAVKVFGPDGLSKAVKKFHTRPLCFSA